MRRIILWKGHHSAEFSRLFCQTWEAAPGNEQLLIACPPVLRDFSFLDQLPPGELFFAGDWNLPLPVRATGTGALGYPAVPVLGVFTTGTTRDVPKLIMYTKENIASCQAEILKLFDRSRIKKIFSYPQPYYVFGLTLGYAMAQINGWELIAPGGRYTSSHHQLWLEQSGDELLTLATPTHLSDLETYCQNLRGKPRKTYTCILGGAKVDREHWLAARDILNIEQPSIGYGCAEAAPGISHLAPGVEPKTGGEIGMPLLHLNIEVLPEGGVRFSGPSLCVATIENGIINFPVEITVRDRVEVQTDGSMVFAARTDMILNRGGEKFSLEHIESTLKDHLGIASICVALPDSRLGQELGLIMVLRTGIDRSLVFQQLEKTFGRRFDSTRCAIVDAIPINDNSKPDRKAAARILS